MSKRLDRYSFLSFAKAYRVEGAPEADQPFLYVGWSDDHKTVALVPKRRGGKLAWVEPHLISETGVESM